MRRCSPASAATRPRQRDSTMRGPRRSRGWLPTRRCARSARPASTYRETASPADQRRAFEAQVGIARELGLPIVIHARDKDGETAAIDEIFELLDARAGDTPVILHCFSAPWRATDAAERGWYCSFAGHTTYPG